MLPIDTAARFAERLRTAGYTYQPVADRLGRRGIDGLARNSTVPATRALQGATDDQATLIRAFALQQPVPTDALGRALGDLTGLAPVLHSSGDETTAAIEIRPYAFTDDDGEFTGWLAADPTPTLDGRLARSPDDFVLGLSPASVTLAEITSRTPVGRALDLGSGCGIQAVHLARHAKQVVATDLNPRACAMTALTAALNGLAVDVREGSLYEPVAGELFDLIVTNPPYVMSPPDERRLVYREGTFAADGLMRAVVTGAPAHLVDGGALQVLGNWAITADESWQDRLAGWIEPTGCDSLVLQREQLDPFEYIEIWLADAGLVGTSEYAARYAEWVRYFDDLGIVAVGLGWLTLYRSGSDAPAVRFDDWPHRTQGGLGAAFAEFPIAAAAARAPDAHLLATRWRCDPAVVSETTGRPGAEHPEHLVLRRGTGFGRAVAVDTALAAVVGACDGDLPLSALIDAVAGLLEVDPDVLRAEVLPRVRPLVEDGFLHVSLN